jgi:hypothetical protein
MQNVLQTEIQRSEGNKEGIILFSCRPRSPPLASEPASVLQFRNKPRNEDKKYI